MAIKALAWMVRAFEPPVYCYHEIVHNKFVVESLEARAALNERLAAIQADNASKLEEMRRTVDEKLHATLEKQDTRRLSHHMVLLGHSMGGLVSKAQVQDSGDRLWINILGDTPEKLGLSKAE